MYRLPNFVKTLHTVGDRIFVGDLQESFHFMRYKKSDNALYVYADDVVPRHVTTALPLDYDTVAGGDKFGNFFITRLPASVSAQASLVQAIELQEIIRVKCSGGQTRHVCQSLACQPPWAQARFSAGSWV